MTRWKTSLYYELCCLTGIYIWKLVGSASFTGRDLVMYRLAHYYPSEEIFTSLGKWGFDRSLWALGEVQFMRDQRLQTILSEGTPVWADRYQAYVTYPWKSGEKNLTKFCALFNRILNAVLNRSLPVCGKINNNLCPNVSCLILKIGGDRRSNSLYRYER